MQIMIMITGIIMHAHCKIRYICFKVYFDFDDLNSYFCVGSRIQSIKNIVAI